MAKNVRKLTTITRLIEDEQRGPELALATLRKHLKTGAGAPYNARANFVAELIARADATAKAVAFARTTQWRVTAVALSLSAALTAAVQLSRHLVDHIAYRAGLSAVAIVAVVLLLVAARRMMDRTEADLAWHREQGKVNDEMLGATLGTAKLAESLASARKPELEDRRLYGEEEDHRAFAALLYRLVVGAGVLAAVVSAALAWL
jgi:hypothetical protein